MHTIAQSRSELNLAFRCDECNARIKYGLPVVEELKRVKQSVLCQCGCLHIRHLAIDEK